MPGMPPAHPSPSADGGTWGGFGEELVARLCALHDGQSLTIDAPDLARPAKLPGLGRRLRGGQYEDVAPWVRLERTEDHAIGRCINDHRELGFPLAAGDKDALLAMGWREPGHGDGPALLRWFPDDVPSAAYLPFGDAMAAADLTVRTMREVFGVADPGQLAVRLA